MMYLKTSVHLFPLISSDRSHEQPKIVFIWPVPLGSSSQAGAGWGAKSWHLISEVYAASFSITLIQEYSIIRDHLNYTAEFLVGSAISVLDTKWKKAK